MSGPSAASDSAGFADRQAGSDLPGSDLAGSELDRRVIEKVASLARLALDEAEIERMTRELSGIVGFVSTLSELATESVEPLAHPLESKNVFRDDVVAPSIPREQALAAAPKHDGECFLVPAVLGDE